jgi:hypothetical protein
MADEPGGSASASAHGNIWGLGDSSACASKSSCYNLDEARISPGDVRYLGLCVGVGGICDESREEADRIIETRKSATKKKKRKKELRLQ